MGQSRSEDRSQHPRALRSFYVETSDAETTRRKEPVKDFLASLSQADREKTLAALKVLKKTNTQDLRPLKGNLGIYELCLKGENTKSPRIFFSLEGKNSEVILLLHGFAKKSYDTPRTEIDTAVARMNDWRARGVTDTPDSSPKTVKQQTRNQGSRHER